ncbi:MAG: TonB-dependent receptor, partial [Campylobacteraceae bacterium]|nr:TonB-dependent receptor [Campylobacteraceae bacterium]
MKCPKGFRGKYFSLAAILALNATVTLAGEAQSIVDNEAKITPKEYAPSEEETLLLEQTPVLVVSKKIKVAEIGAPFASEVYTKKEIQKSHSKDIYEFLNTQTSVTTMPSYGNPFSQAIDMRGYGLGTGYENIVISVDGRRLNNIDMTSQLLSAISLESIERIEIIKGSGSVEYGDGGNAGVINIITKGYDGATVKTYVGNNGLQFASVGLGIKKENFSLSGYFDDYGHDGFKAISSDGIKDESWSRNKELKGTFTPVENLTFNLGKSFSKMQINYANALTLLEYNTNPNTIPSPTDYGFGFFGPDYKIQSYDTNIFSYGFNYKINEYTSFDFQGHDENKKSSYEAIGGSSPGLSESQYNYKSYNSKLNFTNQDFKALIGVDLFDGERDAFSNIVTKDNTAYYSKLEYAFDSKHSTSFGARHETVKYEHNDSVMVLKDDVSLNAFDVGYNYKIDKVSSLFVNINTSYQAPNIDRFFKYNFFTHDYEFNAFIKPMKVKTLNTGYSYLGYPNKLKVSLFYSDID